MHHRASSAFWKEYEALPQEIRSRAGKQFALLKANPEHPSLQFKKLGESRGREIWSARVTLNYRALAIKRPDGYLWFWIGDHETYDSLISYEGPSPTRRSPSYGVGYTLADMPTKKSTGTRFERASDQSLLIYFGEKITVKANEQVRKLLHLLNAEPIAGVRNLHPAYCSLLVKFDALKWRHEKLEKELRKHLNRLNKVKLPAPRQFEIPVCYSGEFGPDLENVAALHGMTPERVIELHTSATYLVYFLGFVPGFAYLGELPQELVTPRLATPRGKVPAGSVGIAGNQTGVYPFETPGGWRLLGRTPLAMFRMDREGLSLLSIGDRVRFVPISRERFAELEKKWA